MATVLREKRIKSADRVLEIFEMFSADRQSVTVMEVARTLGVPQSSTSELLGTLVRQGYLTRDRAARNFRPTARVALLGSWVQPALFRHGKLLPMMDALSEKCGAAVALCSMVGVKLKHIHVVGGSLPDMAGSGTEHHLLHSPFGHALLATIYREHVRKLVHRLNAESEAELRLRFDDLARELDQVRSRGYAAGEIGEGLSAIAVLLPQGIAEEQLSVGFICPTARVEERREELVKEIRGAVAQYFGPRVVREQAAPGIQSYAHAG
jgi:DNA-binding IclR family transcriptional regulator